MTATEKKNGASRSAIILVLVSGAIAMIPGIGFIMWLVGVPVALAVFILSIVMLAKGQTMDGMAGMAIALVVLPIYFVFVPMASIAIFGAKSEHGESASAAATEGSAKPLPDSKPGTTVPDATADPVGIVGEREWTSADGRKMRAALLDVVRGTDNLFVGKFLRDDGREFDLQIGKLSARDVDVVKTAMIAKGLWSEP